jgi:pimeloyl-ACP methyl ester carboxylesterase
MKKIFICFLLMVFSFSNTWAQSASVKTDSVRINNLILPPGYICSLTGAIPPYRKTGKGSPNLIIIPGLGFDQSIFDDFMRANENRYTMYCITIPGYGHTQAPPLPPEGTSFGEQAWNKSVLEGIGKLMAREQIKKAIVVGHFVQGTQMALRMAIDFPELVNGVIILGGPAKFVLISNGKPVEYPLPGTISYIDKVTAPKWFGPISKSDFDAGNYLPEVYSLDSGLANALWKQSASVPLPVFVHALCEFFASDITLELENIKSPVLVLRPSFNEGILQKPVNNYLVPQFIASWDKAALKNPLIRMKDIPGTATCSWKDKPDEVNTAIGLFIQNLKSN